MAKGCRYGSHRVIDPPGSLPQRAKKINNSTDIYDNEILVDVETLNIDAASFTQLEEEAKGDHEKIASKILEIVAERGKMQNPVTGSGGMFIGRVAKIGSDLRGRVDVKKGDRIASMVSLSLTPLNITRIKSISPEKDQVTVEAKAVLFESGVFAKVPDDIPPTLVLAVLDVAGAPAQTARLVKPGDKVLVLGAGGKSGLLCLHEAKLRAGVTGQVIAFIHSERSREIIEKAGLADTIIKGNAVNALEVLDKVSAATGGELADITINCVNIPGTEMASILPTREGGTVYFFTMATSFTAAALGAEGAGRDINMMIGNGYCKDHHLWTLQIMRTKSEVVG
ncbi:MAG: L-erythro-3,5-diaminohexanoate dehydrogenase, partial [Firmicutes bacterium]|nr:L-erythro-3,5-diaminohexanoate dehydrogenase [Bacillota bacterium]